MKERIRQNYPEQLEHVLTSGRKVNKANAETLSATFGVSGAIGGADVGVVREHGATT